MSDRLQHVEQYDEKADQITKQKTPHRASMGIGGGLVGAAIGGLIGRRVGGVSGAVVGAVAGALVGKGTAVRINRTVESVVDAAKSVADSVNLSVNSVENAVKDTIEQVKPSVISVVDAVKDTVEEVKPSVVSVVNAAQGVAEGVNHSVNSVVNTVKDTVEEVKPSVISVVDTVKDTVEQVKSPVVDVAKSVAEAVNQSVNGVVDAVKDTPEQSQPSVINIEDAQDTFEEQSQPSVTVREDFAPDTLEQVQPSVINVDDTAQDTPEEIQPSVISIDDTAQDTPEQVQPSSNYNRIRSESLREQPLSSSPQHALKNDVNNVLARPQKIHKLTRIIVGAATLSFMGVILGFSQQQNLLRAKLPESNQSLSPTPKTTPETTADGWIFIGNINNTSASALVGKPLINGSQSTDSLVVPSVGSIVSINVRPGVTLRNNRPQEPNFDYKTQKALAILKPTEKLKISKVEFVEPLHTNRSASQVWAEVTRCGETCNY